MMKLKNPGDVGGSKKKAKKDRKQDGRKILPPFDYTPPYPSMCYREGPKLGVATFPPLSELEGHLKCSNCNQLSPPESLQCTLGHIICPPCFKEVPSCPKEVTYPDPPNNLLPVVCNRVFSTSSPHWAHRRFFEEINCSSSNSSKSRCIIV